MLRRYIKTAAFRIRNFPPVRFFSYLPTGWRQQIDPASGRPYYVNDATMESRWDPPLLLNSLSGPLGHRLSPQAGVSKSTPPRVDPTMSMMLQWSLAGIPHLPNRQLYRPPPLPNRRWDRLCHRLLVAL